MKLRTRLTISFCIIIFVPILSACLVMFGFQKSHMKTIEQTYGIESKNYNYLMNSVQLLNRYTKKNYEYLLSETSKNPDHFLDQAYLESVNKELDEKYSYLIVRKEDKLIYVGKKNRGTDSR